MRPGTITVDVSRGGDCALWDYRRQATKNKSLPWMDSPELLNRWREDSLRRLILMEANRYRR